MQCLWLHCFKTLTITYYKTFVYENKISRKVEIKKRWVKRYYRTFVAICEIPQQDLSICSSSSASDDDNAPTSRCHSTDDDGSRLVHDPAFNTYLISLLEYFYKKLKMGKCLGVRIWRNLGPQLHGHIFSPLDRQHSQYRRVHRCQMRIRSPALLQLLPLLLLQ